MLYKTLALIHFKAIHSTGGYSCGAQPAFGDIRGYCFKLHFGKGLKPVNSQNANKNIEQLSIQNQIWLKFSFTIHALSRKPGQGGGREIQSTSWLIYQQFQL